MNIHQRELSFQLQSCPILCKAIQELWVFYTNKVSWILTTLTQYKEIVAMPNDWCTSSCLFLKIKANGRSLYHRHVCSKINVE